MMTTEPTQATAEASNRPDSNPNPEPEVMTVYEAAKLLRVEKKKIYEMVARDQLPGARRLGRLIRISRSSLLQWLAAR